MPNNTRNQMADAMCNVLRICLSLIILVAAASKIHVFAQLQEVLWRSGLFPTRQWVPPAAYGVLAVEIGIGVALLLPKFRETGYMLVIMMSSTFIAYSIWRIINRIAVPCTCFGKLFTMTPMDSILLNTLMISVALVLIWRQNRGNRHFKENPALVTK